MFFIHANDYQYVTIPVLDGTNTSFINALLIFLVYITHFISIKAIMDRIEFYNINQLLITLLVTALVALSLLSLLSLLPDIILGAEFGFKKVSQYNFIPVNPIVQSFINKSREYIILLFFLFGLFSSKKLVFVKKDN